MKFLISLLVVGLSLGQLKAVTVGSGVTAGAVAGIGTGGVAAGALVSSSPTAGVGYSTGAGGTVTQATSKSNTVALNTLTGLITTNAASLAATTKVYFTLTDTSIGANDIVYTSIEGGGTANSYRCWIDSKGTGTCVIALENYSVSPLAEAVTIRFIVFKSTNT